MTTSNHVQCNSNNSRLSSDSGIYVALDNPFSELEEAVDNRENTKSPGIAFQENDKVTEKEEKCQDVNVVTNSNPGVGLVGPTTMASPDVGSASRPHIPPPVPPQHLKPKLKAPYSINTPLKTCEKTPLLSGASGSNQSSCFISGEELNTTVDADIAADTNLVPLLQEATEQRQEPKISHTEGKRRIEWEVKEKEQDKSTHQQQSSGEKDKIAESKEEVNVTQRHQDVGKRTARRETLVIFNMGVPCEEGDQQVELGAGWLTHLLMTENLSESTDDDSDFSSEEQDDSKGNAEPEPEPAEPPPNPLPSNILKKCPPKLPPRPPGFCYAGRPDVEEEEESSKKEEDEQQGKEERREHVKGSPLPGHGQTTLLNHKKPIKGMNKITKVIDRLKENREEKKKAKAGGVTMARGREQGAEVMEKGKSKEKKRLKDKEDKEMGDDAVEQTPVTSTLRHVELTSSMDKSTKASSDSDFGSFKVHVSVKLVEDILSGEEWSQFLDNHQKADPSLVRSDSKDTAQLITTVPYYEEHLDAVAVEPEHIYEEIQLYGPLNTLAGSQTCVEQTRAVSSVPTSETPPLSPQMRDLLNSVEFLPPPMNTNNMSDCQSEGVLDTSVQKYVIKLSRRRKRRGPLHHRLRHNKKDDLSGQTPASTPSGDPVFTSVFNNVPCSRGEELPPTVKSGRGSPKPPTKIKMVLKDEDPVVSSTTKGEESRWQCED